jgi:hypothetical protein
LQGQRHERQRREDAGAATRTRSARRNAQQRATDRERVFPVVFVVIGGIRREIAQFA